MFPRPKRVFFRITSYRVEGANGVNDSPADALLYGCMVISICTPPVEGIWLHGGNISLHSGYTRSSDFLGGTATKAGQKRERVFQR